MDTGKLKKFAQLARRSLLEQVTAKLDLVLAPSSAARRENPSAVSELEKQIQQTSREQVIEKVAYTWFNRFCAIRFMDANGYTRIRVVSPANDAQVQPEILAEAKMGHIDEERCPAKTRDKINALLNGTLPSRDPQQEAYRLLLVAECNSFSRAMPYLFEHITDYTELLIPNDLLSANSILAATREAMATEDCQDVEVIGWLYQFYISEKKEEVDKKVKAGGKVTPEEISPKTALFTPHWIVRYLVENSLGRLWMLNHPNSPLAGQMAYYIKPEQPETDFLKIQTPEDIKICDPACGSGHMLTYAFDLLYAIYEEAGTDPSEIPGKILTHNLYGIELDERAGDLAAFALTMKARSKNRRFFNKGIKPNICTLENIKFTEVEISNYIHFIDCEPFSTQLKKTLIQFEEADNYGSLICPYIKNPLEVQEVLEKKDPTDDLFLATTHRKVMQVLYQVNFLRTKYHVVIANPPYATANILNHNLKRFSEKNYPSSNNDLYSMFIERNLSLSLDSGYVGMITMQSWMYLKSFQELRKVILNNASLNSLLHLGPHAFPEILGERVQAAAFTLKKGSPSNTHKAVFFRLISGNSADKENTFLRKEKKVGPIQQNLFLKLPDLSIAYKMLSIPQLRDKTLSCKIINYSARIGSQPGSDLIHLWWEKKLNKIGNRWQKYNKGGTYRKWYGNAIWVLDYGQNGKHVLEAGGQLSNLSFYGRNHISWTRVSSKMNLRYYGEGVFFDNTSPAIFEDTTFLLAYFNSKVGEFNRLGKFSGTKIEAGHVENIAPFIPTDKERQQIEKIATELIKLARSDWDSFETSWDFTKLYILSFNYTQSSLREIYKKAREIWRDKTIQMQTSEEENNRISIEAYGLQDELTPDVPLKEITLTCNPHYRYGGDKTEEELEALLLADTMREFISYAVGCMFGRYSLDKPGLVLANQGETLADYLAQVPNPSFTPDKDNVIPMLDGDWFADDITERFRQFLRTTFGDEHYDENLTFIEDAIGKDIRKFFLRDFYNDHVKRYKKRPIYWLFSSPKGTFNALIYLHRYRPDTVSVVLSYLRDFRNKLDAHLQHLEQVSISTTASQAEKSRALKEIANLKKQLLELDDYEHDTLYPLATQQIAIDLDDGVKVNYLKFGSALKKIAGLEAKGED